MQCGHCHGPKLSPTEAKVLSGSLRSVADYQDPFCYLASCRVLPRMLTSCQVNLLSGKMLVA